MRGFPTLASDTHSLSIMLEVLYEDNHLLVVNKPAGLATMGARAGEHSLLEVAKDYIRNKHNKPGNVFLGTVSRLDEPVTGVTLFARTSKAAARLAKQFRERDVQKTYWAIVAGHPRPRRAELVDWLIKNDAQRRMDIAANETDGAQEARLNYEILKEYPAHSLLKVKLETGRKHQIRVQLASRSHAILGDAKYKSDEPFASGIALHSRRLAVEHPTLHTPIILTAPLPKSWRKWVPADWEAQL
jgi:23S rRNA pseudouridine1911/1915/1917 synthase